MTPALSWSLAVLAAALPLSIGGMNVALALVTILVLAHGAKTPWRAALTPLTAALAAYCLVAFLAAAFGLDPARSLRYAAKDLHKLWAAVVLQAAFRLAPRAPVPEGLAAGFMLSSLAGIRQTLFVRDEDGGWMRAKGFVHAVTYGGQLALGLIFAVRAWAAGNRRALGFIGIMGVAFAFNQTRGAFIAFGAGVLTLGFLEPKLRRWILPALGLGLALLVFWELLPTSRGILLHLREYGWDLARNQQFNRLIFWNVAWEIFTDHPWLGVGPGHYYTVFSGYYDGVLAGQRIWGSAHNLYLHQLAERGLAGGAALALLAATLLRGRGTLAKTLAVVFLALNLTEVSLQNEQVTTLFLFLWCWSQAEK